jgi:hypothetical protein
MFVRLCHQRAHEPNNLHYAGGTFAPLLSFLTAMSIPVESNAHQYFVAEEAIKRQLLDPNGDNKFSISKLSIMLQAVAATQSWELWSKPKHALSIRDLNTPYDANYALRHFKRSHRGFSPLGVLEGELTCL